MALGARHKSGMAKVLISIGALLLVLGGVATTETSDGSLRLFPALVLPLGRPFVAGPDLPGYLTNSGIAAVYLLPATLFVALGGFLWYRSSSR